MRKIKKMIRRIIRKIRKGLIDFKMEIIRKRASKKRFREYKKAIRIAKEYDTYYGNLLKELYTLTANYKN